MRTHSIRTAAAVAACLLAGLGAVALWGPGAGSDESDLPTLPPLEEREPGVFDGDGCLVVDGECTLQADELDAVAAGVPGDEFRSLEGFTGPRYTTDLHRAAVLVLEGTVTPAESPGGTWTALGLARNETDSAVGRVEVSARLLDTSGAELGVATGTTAVAPLRPGEPVPFTVTSSVPAAQVASVEWSAAAAPAEADAPARAAEITTYWTEVAGEREAVSVDGYTDPAGTKPHVVFGSITGLDGADIADPTVVAAWFDADGRVQHIAEVRAISLAGHDELDQLEAADIGDFLLVVDGPVAPALAASELGLWVVAG
jgi:hypothetical protein